MAYRRSVIQASLLLALSAFLITPSASPPDPTGAILRSTMDRYARLSFYQDEGNVTFHVPSEGTTEELCRFATWFARPGRLRFQWRARHSWSPDWDRYALWSDGKAVYSSNSLEEYTWREESLLMAMADAMVPSKAAVYRVPTLLLPETAVFRLDQLTRPRLVRIEQLAGTECFVITGDNPRTLASYTLWIGTRDLLLRQTRIATDDLVRTDTRWNLRVDEPIPREVFTDPARTKPLRFREPVPDALSTPGRWISLGLRRLLE